MIGLKIHEAWRLSNRIKTMLESNPAWNHSEMQIHDSVYSKQMLISYLVSNETISVQLPIS